MALAFSDGDSLILKSPCPSGCSNSHPLGQIEPWDIPLPDCGDGDEFSGQDDLVSLIVDVRDRENTSGAELRSSAEGRNESTEWWQRGRRTVLATVPKA